jgi:predicted 2-oxoglutarate/Fe(II)-dependent dioxygenase YbiX
MKPLVGEVLQAARIAELREAVGVSPNPDSEVTHDEQRLVAWFKDALQAEMEVQRAENDAMLNRLKAEMQAVRATLSTALPRPSAIPERR